MMKWTKLFTALLLTALLLTAAGFACAEGKLEATLEAEIVMNGTPAVPAENYYVQLTPREDKFPMPAGTEGGVWTSPAVSPSGTVSAVIDFSDSDVAVYTYDVVQVYPGHADYPDSTAAGAGMVYDSLRYEMVVTVYWQDGVKTIVQAFHRMDNYQKVAEVVFTNTRQMGSLKVKKTVNASEGADEAKYKAHEFHFRLTLDQPVTLPQGAAMPEKVTTVSATEYTFILKDTEEIIIPYLPVGAEYTLVEEDLPDGYDTPKEYDPKDPKSHTVKLDTPANDGTTVPGNSEVVENQYILEPTTIILSGKKKFSGHVWEESEIFTFTLTPKNDAPVPATGTTVEVKGNRVDVTLPFSFGDIKYEKPGIYVYEITEDVPEDAKEGRPVKGITYDVDTETVTVTVVDNGDGSMTATAAYDEDGVFFENVYTASGTAVIEGLKKLQGRNFLPGDKWKFTLTATDTSIPLPAETEKIIEPASGEEFAFAFDEIAYNETHIGQTFSYTILEDKETKVEAVTNALQSVASVKVTDNKDGTLTCTVTYGEEGKEQATPVAFTNIYNSRGEGKVDALKTLTGRNLEEGQFSFTLKDAEDKEIETVQNTADGTVVFKALPYTQNDVDPATLKGEKTYTITEVQPDPIPSGYTYDGKTITVTMSLEDNGKGTITVTPSVSGKNAEFINNYEASGEVVLEAAKTLEGRDLTEGEFSFILTDENGQEIETVQNAADGTVTFSAIAYDQDSLGTTGEDGKVTYADKTFTYTIAEVVPEDVDANGIRDHILYDAHPETVTVTVVDNGDGTLTATAAYDADGAAFLNAFEHIVLQKTLTSITRDGEVHTDWTAAEAGDLITYTITVTNDGGTVIPAGTVMTDELTRTLVDGSTQTVTTPLPLPADLAPAGTVNLTYTYTVAADDLSLSNIVTSPITDNPPPPVITPINRAATVIKAWVDANNRLGLRPANLVVTLRANGAAIQTFTLNGANDWRTTVHDLPIVDGAGNVIIYTWTEPAIARYTMVSNNTVGIVTTITNRAPGGGIIIEDPEPPLGLGEVFINVGDCLE